jgi:hypothetical protein
MKHPGRPQLDEEPAGDTVKRDRKVALFRSLRAYRNMLDRVALQCYEGMRPMSDLPKAAAFAKVGAEIFLAENQLARAGLDRQFEDHPMGEDGGLGDDILPRGYLEKTAKRKTGISRTGAEIEETVISVTGNAETEELEKALREIADIL